MIDPPHARQQESRLPRGGRPTDHRFGPVIGVISTEDFRSFLERMFPEQSFVSTQVDANDCPAIFLLFRLIVSNVHNIARGTMSSRKGIFVSR